MIERRVIRVLSVYSKAFYFVDRGVQRGLSYDAFRVFEEDLNKELTKELTKDKKLKHKSLKVRVVFIPVARDELLPALIAGKGDIAASNLTGTEERKNLVDFSSRVYRDVSEVVVSGPDSPAVFNVDELAGQVVFVRKSSSYYESLMAFNQRFAGENKPAVMLKEAPEF
ncbi:transporter substrate-binding domain-containing protein [Pseudomonas sp. LB3P81]